jgi:protein-tyrosine phosphatase
VTPLHVVFICTGNRFRSPLAEALLRRAVDPDRVRVVSFGTLELGALAPLDGAVAEARRRQLDLSGHRARGLRGGALAGADLVLGFQRTHVEAAVNRAGARPERSFVLGELVELLERVEPPGAADPVERAREALASAQAVRGALSMSPEALEVPDPLGQPPAAQSLAAAWIERLVDRLVAGLFGPSAF